MFIIFIFIQSENIISLLQKYLLELFFTVIVFRMLALEGLVI